MNLNNLKVGDKIAIPSMGRSFSSTVPRIDYEIFAVTRKTQSLLFVEHQDGRLRRIRIKDGKRIGDDYVYAVEATPELIAEHQSQVDELERYRQAASSLDDLMGRPLHRLALSLEQTERLADAWLEVKKMGVSA